MSEEFSSEHERIARLAYLYWQERGCPERSPACGRFTREAISGAFWARAKGAITFY